MVAPVTPVGAGPDAARRIAAHLDAGAPWNACDAYRAAIERETPTAELRYWGALAHARAGATHVAHALLDEAHAAAVDVPLLVEILSLRGRLWKDALHRAVDDAESTRLALRARDEYRRAHALRGDVYPGINTASLSLLVGERGLAESLARDVMARIAEGARSTWDLATQGEAHLVLGQIDAAVRCYGEAYRTAAGNAGVVATMRRQLRLLARVLPDVAAVLSALPAPDIVAFAGHMIDAPGRQAPRFPAASLPQVSAAIDDVVARMHAPIVFTSAACGADILFIEAALAREAEVTIVLPFDRDDFVRTSVAPGGDGWLSRFDAVLARASRVVMATEEGYLGDDVLFEHAALLVEGLAIVRAQQLDATPSMLCVLDRGDDARVGGTRASASAGRAPWARRTSSIRARCARRPAPGRRGRRRLAPRPAAPTRLRSRSLPSKVARRDR